MKIIKKNQLTILVIALMLVTAGYLNYTSYNGETELTSSTNIVSKEENVAGIGDAKLVNSQDITENVVNNLQTEDIGETEKENLINNTTNNTIENNKTDTENTVTTSSNTNTDEYFVKSRLDREKMYSQMIESYQKILESSLISEEQKAVSQQEINNINKTKNAIMIAENLIKTKGFEECIIFINDKSINIIVKDDEVTPEEIAQIQNIVSRELGSDIENIHITNK